MSTHADILGQKADIPLAGLNLTPRPINDKFKAEVEQWLRKLAYVDLYSLKGMIPADQYADALATITRDRASYVYDGPVFWATVGTLDGSTTFTAMMFGITEEQARELSDSHPEEVSSLIEETIVSSMPRARAAAVREFLAQQRAARESGENPTSPPTS